MQVVAAYPDHIVNIAAYFSNFEDEGKPLDDPELRHTTKKEVVDKFFEDEVMQLIDVSVIGLYTVQCLKII